MKSPPSSLSHRVFLSSSKKPARRLRLSAVVLGVLLLQLQLQLKSPLLLIGALVMVVDAANVGGDVEQSFSCHGHRVPSLANSIVTTTPSSLRFVSTSSSRNNIPTTTRSKMMAMMTRSVMAFVPPPGRKLHVLAACSSSRSSTKKASSIQVAGTTAYSTTTSTTTIPKRFMSGQQNPSATNHHNNNVGYYPSRSSTFSTITTSTTLWAMSSSSSSSSTPILPTLEQLSKDPFMKQVQYGSELTSMLVSIETNNNKKEEDEDDNDETTKQELLDQLRSSLVAQLSHSDGIRGFMVSYLTRNDNNNNEEADTIPDVLLEALIQVNNPKEVVPLACMNVIMPTAMTTMHQDPDLAASSAMTSRRGTGLLQALLEYDSTTSSSQQQQVLIEQNCQAILAVATSDEEREKEKKETDEESLSMHKYWTDFFQKWGYEEPQKRDIATVMRSILKPSITCS